MPAFLRVQVPRGAGFLWITSRADAPTPDRADVVRVTSIHENGTTVDPKRLQDLRAAVRAFLARHAGGLVVLDCIDDLAIHNGIERVLRAVADLHEDAVTLGATLIVFLDPAGANPRLVAWLERELDMLPVEVPQPAAPEVFLS